MMYRYLAVKLPGSFNAGFLLVPWGLLVQKRRGEAWETLKVTPDISCDEAFVKGLARLFTEHQLDPVHLCDLLYDLL